MISTKEIKKRIQIGETIETEFKKVRNEINKSVYQTVCAFLNRVGGYIFLGVDDAGKIIGVDPDVVPKMKKEFIDAINNPQKFTPPVYLTIEDIKINGKIIIVIYVPESSQVHRVNGRFFDRNENGDLDITNHTDNVTLLYIRKQSVFSENKVFPYLTMEEFRGELFDRVRKIVRGVNATHPWIKMTNAEILHSLGFYQKDYASGKEGYTLAAGLLFARDEVILSLLPYHKTDAILRRNNLDRYDDRDIVETNLIDSFERLLTFVKKHLNDPFYIEGTNRISLRNKIFREVVSNILIHREYLSPFPSKLIIGRENVITENAKRAHGIGLINTKNFSPFPKNPKIARFFREIGRADELGSGVRNIYKYTPVFSNGKQAELIEDDIFKIIIPLPEVENYFPIIVEETVEESGKNYEKKTVKMTVNETMEKYEKATAKITVGKTAKILLMAIKENPKITVREMETITGLNQRGVEWIINKLKTSEIVKRIGPHKGGYWEVIEQKQENNSLQDTMGKTVEKTVIKIHNPDLK
jgi:ATP-dependent DNA helicase RecG